MLFITKMLFLTCYIVDLPKNLLITDIDHLRIGNIWHILQREQSIQYTRMQMNLRMSILKRKPKAPKIKIISQPTLELLKANLDEIGLNIPLRREDLTVIYDWFQDREIELSNALADGESIDPDHLNSISRAADDFRIYEGENEIDLDDLNNRLKAEF